MEKLNSVSNNNFLFAKNVFNQIIPYGEIKLRNIYVPYADQKILIL